MGLLFIGMMAFPFACSESGGCRLGIVTPWSAFSWPARAGIALFVLTGIALILRGLGLPTAASIAGIGLLPLFAAVPNAILFGLNAPACAPIIGAMRALAEVPPYPGCAVWPTVAALWIDAFFIGFALEVVRKEFLPEPLREPLKNWTQGLLLLSLSPLLLLLFALLLPKIGGEALKEHFQRWRNG
jgi:hypothetical protein